MKKIIRLTLAALLLLAGGTATVLGVDQERLGGYYGSDEQRFTSTTATLKTDEIYVGEVDARPGDPMPDAGEWARVRIVVRNHDPGTRLFIGIGPKDRVEDYLRGTAYDDFAGARLEPFSATFRRVAGQGTPAVPEKQTFWVATGTNALEWDKTKGAWSFVVMRADGGSGLDVSAWIGLRFGFLLPAGIVLLIVSGLLFAWPLLSRRWYGTPGSSATGQADQS
ncbi:hypothetical protein [Nonomuraea endophytica]|uniref:hypothetical protein n=1 Tax=Nonomuraea endophytica TaxID=714136 RepID=UPI0037C9D2BE